MYRLLSVAVVTALLLTGCANTIPLHETSAPQDIVVARFLLDVDGLEADFPDQGGGLIPVGARAVRTGRDVAKAGNTLLHPENSAVKAVQDSVFTVFSQALATRSDLRLLPLETLRGEVPYLVAAPMGQGQEVAIGRSAIEMDVFVEVPDAEQGSWSILGTGRARVSGHPEMTVSVRMFGPDGQVTWRERVRVRSREKVVLDERWLLAVNVERDVSDASTLYALTHQAVDKLMRHSRPA